MENKGGFLTRGIGHSLPEAFIFEKTKNGSKKSFATNQPKGACGILRVLVQAGRANSHIWTPIYGRPGYFKQ